MAENGDKAMMATLGTALKNPVLMVLFGGGLATSGFSIGSTQTKVDVEILKLRADETDKARERMFAMLEKIQAKVNRISERCPRQSR